MIQTMNVDYLDRVPFTKFLREVDRSKPFTVGRQVEERDNINLPPFNLFFDIMVKAFNFIPDANDFAEYYMRQYSVEDAIKQYNIDRNCLANRLKRAYRSFVQEYGIYILLRDNNINGLYDRGWDLKGVDFVINPNTNKQCGLYVINGSQSASNWCKHKDKYRRKGITMKTKVLQVKHDVAKLHNGIYLFENIGQIRQCLI